MIILSGKNIGKSYGIEVILEGVSFTVQENDKIGIVGVNGAGKSTLLKIITGQLDKDEGELYAGKNIRIGYMSQDFDFQSDNTVWEEMLSVFGGLLAMESSIRELELKISAHTDSEEAGALETLLKSYANLQEQYKSLNGFGYQSQIKGVLRGLGFAQEEFDKKVSLLSGGQKTRVALGKTLLQQFDLLLLDEPTNYLDISSVEWLEEYLKTLKSAVIIVSHDRYFLDVTTNRTFEIENRTLTEYNGGYSVYIEKKREQREIQLKNYLEQQKEIERQEAIIARFRQYNREKSIKQAESREKALERLERIERPDSDPKSVSFKFEPRIKSGNDVLKLEALAKAFDRPLFKNADMEITRGEKVALLGPNGIGKTTLLNILSGRIKADSGSIRLGTNVNIGYYEQEQESLDSGSTVIDEVWDEYPELNQTELRTKLAAFLFQGDDVFKNISSLSGGEKSRIALLKLMLSKSNFLLLDEPTNHLDILSKEVLENALLHYSGTVLMVSHDRYFINRVATRIIELSPEGCVQYLGNYSYYLERKHLEAAAKAGGSKAEAEKDSETKNQWVRQKEEKSNQRKQQKRLETVEAEIESSEARLVEIAALMEQPEIFSDHVKCQELHHEDQQLRKSLDALYEEWSELNE